jgi:hypothetical protein
MRIGVFGDSFADRTPYNPDSPFKEDESWIQAIQDGGNNITTYGKTGTSSWYSFEQFLAHHDQFDHIVFMYSSPHRMHHLPEGLEGLHFLNTPDDLYAYRRQKGLSIEQELEIVRILTGRVINISPAFDVWVRQKIFSDVNNICRNKKIKLVNVLTFEDRKEKHYSTNLEDRAGDCLYNLLAVSKKELPTMGQVDNRWCHLSKELNLVFSQVISQSFNSTDRNIVDLFKIKDLTYDNPEITARYTDDPDKIKS